MQQWKYKELSGMGLLKCRGLAMTGVTRWNFEKVISESRGSRHM